MTRTTLIVAMAATVALLELIAAPAQPLPPQADPSNTGIGTPMLPLPPGWNSLATGIPPNPAQYYSKPSFSKDIVPIFKEKCVSCHHAPDGEGYRKSGLDLSSYEDALAGTKSDQKVKADYPYNRDAESQWKLWWLMWLVDWRGPNELRMPHGSDHQLSARDRDAIRTWIREGAWNN
jgi:hypothetical protein